MAIPVNDTLLHAAIDHSIDQTRYSSGVIRRIIAILNKADSHLFLRLTAALEQMPPDAFSVQRLESLLAEVRDLNARAYATIRQNLESELADLVRYEIGYQQQLFEHVLPVQVGFASVSVETAYAAAMARPFQGRLLSEWAAGIESDRMARIRDTIRIGFVEGQTVADMVRQLRGTQARGFEDGIIQIDRRNAESIVRTAVSHTANFARQRFYEGNSGLIKGLRWVATLDGRTSPICRARDGKVFPVNSGPRPPAHWNCLPGTSKIKVSGSITRAYKRPYEGQLFIIKTASGRELSCTPNHPILSDRGWIPAQSLNLGDNVVCDMVSDRVSVSDNAKNNNVPTSIQDIAESFFVSSGVITVEVPISAPDFHGDGIGSQVAVVGTDCRLLVSDDATVSEHSREDIFSNGSPLGHSLVVRCSSEQLASHRDSAPCGSDISGMRDGSSFLGGTSGHAGELLSAPITKADASLFEGESDCRNGQVELFGDTSDANSAIKHRFGSSEVESSNGSLQSPVLHHASTISSTVLVEYPHNHLISDTVHRGDFCDRKSGLVQVGKVSNGNVNPSAMSIHPLAIEDIADIGYRHSNLFSDSGCCLTGQVHRQDRGHESFSGDSHLFKPTTNGDTFGSKSNTDGIIGNSKHSADFFDSTPIDVEIGNTLSIEYFSPFSGNSGFVESAVDGADIDTKIARNILDGNACAIFLDHIVSIDVQDFSGHVYNLETDCGWFVADGIITHNCRSTMSPVVKSWKELGIDLEEMPPSTRASMSGQVPEDTTYQEWLRKQSAARQDEILGASRGKLFRKGMGVDRFVDNKGRTLTIDELRRKDAETFRKAGI